MISGRLIASGDGLADAGVFENRIASVERDVIEDRAGAGLDRNARVVAEGIDLVGAERVHANVGRALLQFESAGDLVGNDGEADALDGFGGVAQ
jgi:hypothetical protein